MSSRIRWWNVVLGICVTLLSWLLFSFFVGSVIDPYLATITGVDTGGVGAKEEALYGPLSAASMLSALVLAFFVGGVVAGGSTPSSPGLNGATTVTGLLVIVLACLLGNALTLIVNPVSDTPVEDASTSLIVAVALCAVFPFGVLAGFLGGRLGGRLRNRAAPRAAS